MLLPAPIRTYFDADKHPAGAAPTGAFAVDAVVHDEGKTHVGHDAIGAWFRQAKAQNQHSTEPREISEEGGFCVIRAEVTGPFPGSPALLTFRFKLQDGLIEELEIRG